MLARFLHSRICLVIVAVIAVIWAIVLGGSEALPYPQGNGGLVEAWSGEWMPGTTAGMLLGVSATLFIAFVLVNINTTFNLLRNITHLQASAFIIMQMAAPATVVSLNRPVAVVAVVLACIYLLFSTYAKISDTPTVFLIFFLLSVSAGFDIIFIGLIPVFLLCCAQMRILSLRSILAMLMGVATPWIILLGFGIVSPADLSWPQPVSATERSMWLLPLVTAVSLSALVLVSSWLQNLIKYLTYNAHSRAMLSMLTVLGLVAIIFVALGYKNLYACLPLLNMCAALQLAHLFGVIHTRRKSYIAIICIFFPFLLLTIWTTALCM